MRSNSDKLYMVKIADFGLATYSDMDSSRMSYCAQKLPSPNSLKQNMTFGVGTSMYGAPEQLHNDGQEYTSKADIFSLGLVLAELFTPPFSTFCDRIIFLDKLRKKKDVRDILNEQLFPREVALIRKMMSTASNTRPNALE